MNTFLFVVAAWLVLGYSGARLCMHVQRLEQGDVDRNVALVVWVLGVFGLAFMVFVYLMEGHLHARMPVTVKQWLRVLLP